MAISAGPLFKFTPAVSFLVACKTAGEVDVLWKRLSKGGKTLMPLDTYPFSGRYGWTEDRYGLSWQVMLTDVHKAKRGITPTLMFVGRACGKAEEAIRLYASVFRGSKVGGVLRYGKGEEPDRKGTLKHAEFTLAGQPFAAMDSAYGHEFGFNEAVSFIVNCRNQKEIDYYWSRLSAVPEAEQCGWIKDRFGLSWQIVPIALDEMLRTGGKRETARLTQAFLKMRKFDVARLKQAFRGQQVPKRRQHSEE